GRSYKGRRIQPAFFKHADHIKPQRRRKRRTMNARNLSKSVMGAAVLAAWMLVPSAVAQRGRGPQGPQVVSPEVSADRRITFRILAARAQTVRLNGGDIPGNSQGSELTKGTNGIWEVTLGPIEPGTYRYNFG